MRLRNARLVVALLGVAGYLSNATPSGVASAAEVRPVTGAKYVLELNGTPAGALVAFEGGDASGDVATEKLAPDRIVRKHVVGVKYADVTLTTSAGMSRSLYELIKGTFERRSPKVSGAAATADASYDLRSRLTFANAVVSEVTFPLLDGNLKEAAKMTVKLAPESTKSLAATGKLTGGFGAAQKRWLPSDFRLRIDGLDDACTHVTRIEPFSVKQKVVDGSMGVLREPTKEPASLEVSNLVITVPEANVAELVRWHQSFVLQGQSGDDKEKEGTLDYMTPNSQEVLFSLKLHHLGIFKLVPDKSELGTETVRRVRAEMYVESVDFSYNTAAAAP